MNRLHLIVRILCLLCFLYQFYSVLAVYLEYNFSVTMDERQRGNHIVFPGVTVCVDGWLSIEKLCQYRHNKCQKHDMIYAPGVYIAQAMPELRVATAFRTEDLFSCFMTAGSPQCAVFNCTDRIKSAYYRIPSQQCYTIDVNAIPREEHPFKDCPNQWDWELELHYKFSKRDTMLLLPRWVYPLFVHQTGLSPPDQLSAVQLLPGKIIHVTVQQLRTVRLPAPYKSKCTDYKALGSFKEFKGRLNYDDAWLLKWFWNWTSVMGSDLSHSQLCVHKCSMELEVIHCGCIQAAYEFTASYPAPTCDFQESENCKAALDANDTYSKCDRICSLPCEAPPLEAKEKFTLKLRYRSDIEELVLYQPTLTSVELLAYAGGYMGIWLGASALAFLLDLYGKVEVHKNEIEKTFSSIWTGGTPGIRLKKERWTDRVIALR